MKISKECQRPNHYAHMHAAAQKTNKQDSRSVRDQYAPSQRSTGKESKMTAQSEMTVR